MHFGVPCQQASLGVSGDTIDGTLTFSDDVDVRGSLQMRLSIVGLPRTDEPAATKVHEVAFGNVVQEGNAGDGINPDPCAIDSKAAASTSAGRVLRRSAPTPGSRSAACRCSTGRALSCSRPALTGRP